MQIWTGMGRIASDYKVLGSNGKVATASFAVDREMKGMDGKWITDFLNLRFLGEKMVSRVEKELPKGTLAVVYGKVCHEAYTDRNGERKYNDYILVERFRAPKIKSMDASNDGTPAATPTETTKEEFINIPDNVDSDGMPFN